MNLQVIADIFGPIIVWLGWAGGIVMLVLLVMFIQDIVQREHTVRRNFPVIGRLRYFLERQGEFFRQYFFAGDRQEMPFNRATRAWIYRSAKGSAAPSALVPPTTCASPVRSCL